MLRAIPFIAVLAASAALGQDHLQWTGFALLRASSVADGVPLQQDALGGQVQLGLDWSPSPLFNTHVHLLARDDDESDRGNVGIPEAYAELNLRPKGDRLRIRGGAFFLPTSRENVDALWENPYAISSSALNTWFGDELRPVGLDVSYFHEKLFAGATAFRGNDTFGALPAVRGWTLGDRWTLLGEWVRVDPEYYTSVSAETDGRYGWSARGGWNGEHLLVQLTHIDNRSDGEEHGHLFNWGTRFDIAAAEYTRGDWTVAAETGWGPTFLIVRGSRYTNDLYAGYLLVSRNWPRIRTTVRAERFSVDDADTDAITVAALWTAVPRVRIGAEVTAAGSDRRALVEVRYRLH